MAKVSDIVKFNKNRNLQPAWLIAAESAAVHGRILDDLVFAEFVSESKQIKVCFPVSIKQLGKLL